MRTIATILAVLVLTGVPLPSLAGSSSDTRPHDSRLYDRADRYQGRVTSDGHGQTRMYDRQGRYQGRTSRQGKTVRLYDKSGRYIGRVEAR